MATQPATAILCSPLPCHLARLLRSLYNDELRRSSYNSTTSRWSAGRNFAQRVAGLCATEEPGGDLPWRLVPHLRASVERSQQQRTSRGRATCVGPDRGVVVWYTTRVPSNTKTIPSPCASLTQETHRALTMFFTARYTRTMVSRVSNRVNIRSAGTSERGTRLVLYAFCGTLRRALYTTCKPRVPVLASGARAYGTRAVFLALVLDGRVQMHAA